MADGVCVTKWEWILNPSFKDKERGTEDNQNCNFQRKPESWGGGRGQLPINIII